MYLCCKIELKYIIFLIPPNDHISCLWNSTLSKRAKSRSCLPKQCCLSEWHLVSFGLLSADTCWFLLCTITTWFLQTRSNKINFADGVNMQEAVVYPQWRESRC